MNSLLALALAPRPSLSLEPPRVDAVSFWELLLNYPPVKALMPAAVVAAIAPVVWWFFHRTWRRLDEESRTYIKSGAPRDFRPHAALALLGITLTIQEYYGGRAFFNEFIEPWLQAAHEDGQTWLRFPLYRGLYSYGWWVFARVLGYVIVPVTVWKILFPRDSILDMGLRVRGFLSHLWIYALCLAVVIGAMFVAARQPDFLDYYPFYKASSRSWFDLLAWESIYFLQFLALEFYFRGWLLEALRRSMGSAAIFVMAVPYCMIHYGKPYLEAHGAIIAGVVLGSLAMHTRSIYAGFLVHVTVAGLMDYLALASRDGLPTRFWPE